MINAFFILKNDRFFRLLEPYLNQQGIAIAEISNNVRSAQYRLRDIKPDIVIMDANWPLPGFSTREMLQDFLQDDPAQKIILVTNTFEPRTENLANTSGAYGYIYRCMDNIKDMTDCIRNAVKGKCYVPSWVEER